MPWKGSKYAKAVYSDGRIKALERDFLLAVWMNVWMIERKWMKKGNRDFLIAAAGLAGLYAGMKAAAWKTGEDPSIDNDNLYLSVKRTNIDKRKKTIYERLGKPVLDQMLAFSGLVVLSPLYAVLSLAVYIDDPGPVFFTQKRVGKGKHFFMLHKYRSMKMSAPHDVPTHMLEEPEKYITRVGRILRKSSLDELPQIWDVFRGKMSVVGPRPALWNQEDLISYRDIYGANEAMPGMTGLAQIQGRDMLEIPDKAKADGRYTSILRKGGPVAFAQDIRCFFRTFFSAASQEGVVEGAGGSAPLNVGFEDYGFHRHFSIDKRVEKKVLIAGAGSYIGESLRLYVQQHYPGIQISTIDMRDENWRKTDFGGFDAVFYAAGIAHADTGRISPREQKKYYAVNTDLTIAACRKAKSDGAAQFIFLSSMIVYGNSAPVGARKVIDEHTIPDPAGFYGDSKWQADAGIRKLADQRFHVAVLRLPMIYGKGSKGNYQILAKFARKIPLVPDIWNERSMLYVENLCEFAAQLICSGEGGIYFPQNSTYTKTSDMIRMIAETAGRKVHLVSMPEPVVNMASHMPGKPGKLVNKAFGSMVYSQKLSQYDGLDYQKISFAESIRLTEGADAEGLGYKSEKQIHILIISQYFHPENFRVNDMAKEWVKRGYKVTVLTGIPNYPVGRFFEGYSYTKRRHEQWHGVEIIRIPLIPRGKGSIGMVLNYLSFAAAGWIWKTISAIRADIVFSYEVSPMTQALVGCWYCRKHRVPHFLYIQDLWPENVETVTGIRWKAFLKPVDQMVDYIYSHTDQIFTTSQSFVRAVAGRTKPVDEKKVHYWPQYAEGFYKPLSREAVRKAAYKDSPVHQIPDDGSFKIAFTGNIGTAQGLDILPRAAEKLQNCSRTVRFVIVGGGRQQSEFEEEIRKWGMADSFILIPRQKAEVIPELLACCDAAFLSFQDTKLWEMTIPAKLQSYMACGMPVIAAVQGETEHVIKEAGCGICCKIGDADGLAEGIAGLLGSDLERMGKKGRAYCMEHYSKKQLMDEMDDYMIRELKSCETKSCKAAARTGRR